MKTAFVAAYKQALRKALGEQPENNPDLGRIITERHAQRLCNLLEDAVTRGAVIETGGQFDIEERYVAPTLLTRMSSDSRLMQEEIFGPLMPVIPYESLPEALEIIRKKEKPLALYVFSRSRRFVDTVLHNSSAGEPS